MPRTPASQTIWNEGQVQSVAVRLQLHATNYWKVMRTKVHCASMYWPQLILNGQIISYCFAYPFVQLIDKPNEIPDWLFYITWLWWLVRVREVDWLCEWNEIQIKFDLNSSVKMTFIRSIFVQEVFSIHDLMRFGIY